MKKIIRKAKLSLMINWRFLCKFHISTIKSKIQTRFMGLNTRDSKVNESKLVSGQTGKKYTTKMIKIEKLLLVLSHRT